VAKNLDDDLNRFFAADDKPKTPAAIFDDYEPSKSQSAYISCADNHPALKIPGTEFVIYGGSCIHPFVKDADVYIGFDWGMKYSKQSYPWNAGRTEFLFQIDDMAAPRDPVEFKKLVDWTVEQLRAGKKVHCGCIGGHGRTGTFLAALVSVMSDEKDSITYVRKNYCSKAVETSGQIRFLEKEFGILPVAGSKSHTTFVNGSGKKHDKKPKVIPSTSPIGTASVVINPIDGFSIWD
jgi:hypothetical protein